MIRHTANQPYIISSLGGETPTGRQAEFAAAARCRSRTNSATECLSRMSIFPPFFKTSDLRSNISPLPNRLPPPPFLPHIFEYWTSETCHLKSDIGLKSDFGSESDIPDVRFRKKVTNNGFLKTRNPRGQQSRQVGLVCRAASARCAFITGLSEW